MTANSFSPLRFVSAGIVSAVFGAVQLKSSAQPAIETARVTDVAVIERFPKQPPLPEVKDLDDTGYSPVFNAARRKEHYPDIRKPTGAQQSMAVFSKNRAMRRDLRFR